MIGRSPFSSWLAKSFAVVAQLVERVLGKDEVTSSILVNGSSFAVVCLRPPEYSDWAALHRNEFGCRTAPSGAQHEDGALDKQFQALGANRS